MGKVLISVVALVAFCGLVTSLPGRADLVHMDQSVADASTMNEESNPSRGLQKSGKKSDKTEDMEEDKKGDKKKKGGKKSGEKKKGGKKSGEKKKGGKKSGKDKK